MEPISLIIAALVAGATAATKDTAGKAVKDAYEGLKSLIKKKFADKGKKDEGYLVDKQDKEPNSETVKALLKEEIIKAGIDQDEEVLKKAEAFKKLLESSSQSQDISDIQQTFNNQIQAETMNMQQGNNNTQNIGINQKPKQEVV